MKQYTLGMVSFVNGDEQEMAKAGPREFVGRLEVEPNTPIGPGETRAVRLRIVSKLFADERIVPTHAPQQFIAGLLRHASKATRDPHAAWEITGSPFWSEVSSR